MTPLGRVAVAALLLGAGLTGTAGAESPAAGTPPATPKVRGITISTHTDGREWGWDVIGPTLQEIKRVGAGWVATHPYAWIGGDGAVRFRDFDPQQPPEYLVRPIREAHQLGLKVMIKPHLGYWGSPFSWRGEIEFDRPEHWERFWSGYSRWILKLAAACKDADGFAVGTELDRTLEFGERWRELIAGVRERTTAPLTYAANWTDYRRVPFWDVLDVIGIQAYFPLTDQPSTDRALIERGWRERLDELRQYARRHHRRIVFTELGYNRSLQAAHRPWESRVDGPEAEAFQEQLLRIALQVVERDPLIAGAFLWKWFPEPYPVGRNFQLATPRLKRAIAEAWK